MDDTVRRRVEEARQEVERALESIRHLSEQAEGGSFAEESHKEAKARLRAALLHLESLRPAHIVPQGAATT